MDNFRWILLAAGVLFVVIVYLISRKNKREFYQDGDNLSEDLPEVNTRSWDNFDEGVGEVRIIARSNDDVSLNTENDTDEVYFDEHHEAEAEPVIDDNYVPVYDNEAEQKPEAEPEIEPEHEAEEEAGSELAESVLVLNILARDGSVLPGKSINSVAHANGMVFGDMNIYHRLDENNISVFSMINMVKPGSFDPSTIHELSTPGVSLFLQLPGPSNASDAFHDMLQTAYRMSEILEARLCDRSRQPLTESVVEEYRKTAASFDGKN